MASTAYSVPMYFPPAFGSTQLSQAQTCAALVRAAYDQFQQFMAQKTPDPGNFTWKWTGPQSPRLIQSRPSGNGPWVRLV